MTTRLIDLSHTIESGMITYKGLPAPLICDFLTREESAAHYADGTSFHIGKIEMVSNTGTYMDVPFHRFAHGKDLAQMDLASMAALPGICLSADQHQTAIGPKAFERSPVPLRGKAVLVHTGWSRHWRTDAYFEGHPFLTEASAVYLREAGAALVGIDSYNIDDIRDGRRPVHTILLGAGIPIVEHMTELEQLPVTGFRFHAAPAKVAGVGSFPVRAYAALEAPDNP